MATTNTWEEVIEKISGVVNRGAFSKTFTPTTSSQSASGAAGYYSSVSTTCNAVSLSGNAGTGQVLTGYTFYNNSLTRQTGAMANRGNLNWNPTGSTTYSVSAGYYSGGTLNSGTAYTNGYNNGVSSAKMQYKELRFSVQVKGTYTTAGTYTATRTGTHLFVFHKISSSQPNAMYGQALLNGSVISSFVRADYSNNPYSWRFTVSLNSGAVVTFQLMNSYGKYISIIDGAVAF